MENLSRKRIKIYLVTEDNWFIKCDNYLNNVEKVYQIEDASSFYSEYDAIKVYEKCKQLGIVCKIIRYKISYVAEQEIKLTK